MAGDRALALQPRDGADGEASSSGRRVVLPRHELPLGLLLARADAAPGALSPAAELRRVRRDADWASKREYMLAAAAAGFHLAVFAFSLAFWGFEGTPPDRYWPDNVRVKLGMRPGRYGSMGGAKKLWFNYLSRIDGPGPKGAV